MDFTIENIKLLAIGAVFLILLIWEIINHRIKSRNLNHDGSNILLGIVNIFLVGIIISQITPFLIETLNISLYKISLPVILKVIVAFIVLDFWLYVWHRLNHTIKFLSRFHMVHHTDDDMNITTVFRFHPIEFILSVFFRLPVLLVFKIGIKEIIIYETFMNVVVYFHHSSINIPYIFDKILNIFIVTPNMHRLHHSVILKESNNNYGAITSLWDRMFNSYIYPEKGRKVPFGIPGYKDKKWQNFQWILVTPFVKLKR